MLPHLDAHRLTDRQKVKTNNKREEEKNGRTAKRVTEGSYQLFTCT